MPTRDMQQAVEEPAVPEIIDGRVAWIFGDDFDIDLVIGVENIKYYDLVKLRSALMKAYDESFVDSVREGDVLVGGRNFGYGHPHYPPLVAMRSVGIKAIVAESFSPGFWRGETYNGMPLIACPGIAAAVKRWDQVRVHWAVGKVETPAGILEAARPSDRVARILRAGGSYNLLLRERGLRRQ